MMQKAKVLFYTNIPSPYRVDFFNELGKKCDLTVLFELKNSNERDKEWDKYDFINFRGIFMKGIRLNTDTAFCPSVIRHINKTYDQVIISYIGSPTACLMAWILKHKKIPYYFEGDGGFAGSIKGIKAYLKRYIISNAEMCLSTSKEFDKYCLMYGACPDKILRYPFTSVKEKEVLSNIKTPLEKSKLRNELGMQERGIIISVGQFIHRKGFDLLLAMSKELKEDIGVYIIGGTPTEEYLEMCKKWNLQHVHFLPFMNKERLNMYYQAADVFAFFTREDIWGLVICEAMANGLPVVSSDRCLAATEMITNDVNGYIVQNENLSEMKRAIDKIMKSEQIRQKMSKNAIQLIRNKYTIEKMAESHLKIFDENRVG